MYSVDCLREFVNERLTAAAEEIFGVLKKTIVDFEGEIARQRRQLDIAWKPEVKLHRIELPRQHVCKQEEVLCVQERSSSLDQEDPEPPQIKEEPEDLCTSQEGEQLGLKQDTDALMLSPTNEESHPTENQTVCLNSVKTPHEAEEQSDVRMPFIISVVSESDRDHQLLSNSSHSAESRDQKGDDHGDSGPTRNTESSPKKICHESKSHTEKEHNRTSSKIQSYDNTGYMSPKCDICGKTFSFQCALIRHMKTHTGEKPFLCKTCGRSFSRRYVLTVHMRTHTGEKPDVCKTCGKAFRSKSDLTVHMRIHTRAMPFLCKNCGKGFQTDSEFIIHMRTHTGEKPFLCKKCGKAFRSKGDLTVHTRIHTGAKPYTCETCGRAFGHSSHLTVHKRRAHTGEKPYLCKTCGRAFYSKGHMTRHMKTHTGEKPHSCNICAKRYRHRWDLKIHLKNHSDEDAVM